MVQVGSRGPQARGGVSVETEPRCVKAGSQSDAKPCVALIRETHKFITKKSREFLDDQTQERNAGERKGRIRIYPSVVLRFYKRRRKDDATQRIV